MIGCLPSISSIQCLCGILDTTEMVKVDVSLLGGRVLIWWRSVSYDAWAMLGTCDWTTLTSALEAEFHDLHHDFCHWTKLLDLK